LVDENVNPIKPTTTVKTSTTTHQKLENKPRNNIKIKQRQ